MADNTTLAATVDMLRGSAEGRSWQEPKPITKMIGFQHDGTHTVGCL